MFQKKFTVFTTALMVLTISFGGAVAGPFSAGTLDVNGRVVDVLAQDLDGDGKLELVASYTKGFGKDARARLAVFYNNEGSYPASPDIDIQFPKDACVFDVGDLDNNGIAELFIFRKWQIDSVPLSKTGAGKTTMILKKGSGIMFPNPEGVVPYENLVRDWNGDGGNALALPDYGRLRFYIPNDGGQLSAAQALAIQPRGSISTSGTDNPGQRGYQLQSGQTFPALFISPEGISPRKLIAAFEQDVWYHEDFAEKGRRFNFPIITEKEKRDGNMNVTTRVMDLDGDGYPEVILNKYGGSLRGFYSEVLIYKGKVDGFESTPCYKLSVDGFTPMVQFWDIDNDGHKDMVISVVDIGLAQIARMMLSQTAKVQFKVYKCRGSGNVYGESPDMTRKMTYRIETEPRVRFVGFTPDFGGDYNGDGKNDLVMAHSKGFGVWINKGGLKFTDGPDHTMELAPTDTYRMADLNGDKKCDIYLWDSANPDKLGKITVLTNGL